ncbi:MAG: hypothetical protein ABJO88_00080 [Parasphingorhabdus sp.]
MTENDVWHVFVVGYDFICTLAGDGLLVEFVEDKVVDIVDADIGESSNAPVFVGVVVGL